MLKCRKPFRNFGCGQCMPCRITKRRIWTHRIVLESLKHAENSFLTLTYGPDFVPEGGTLIPRHAQLFLKRLRRRVPEGSLRFYLVGEYGESSQRPHYHAALFGIGPESSSLIEESWGLGHSMLGDLTPASARYIAGYVTKKMTSKDDPRLNGRHPEFSRMSLKPGIGAPAVGDIASALNCDLGLLEIDKLGDVPMSLQHGVSQLPLGRYLREKLRTELGFLPDGSLFRQPWKDARDKLRAEEESLKLQALWLNYQSSPKAKTLDFPSYLKGIQYQQIANTESRFKVYNSKGSL